MFRLHRNKSGTKSGEKISFKFSNFQVSQVPKSWDGLFISIISLETGKTTAKSSKALVRNGSCQWTDTLSESIWISQDDSSTELEERLFKFVVSMGSARSGILGEVIINMTDYMNSRTSAPVMFPLKKCSHGTTLQVKIHCLTPRTRLRDDKSKDSNSAVEDLDADCPHMGAQSDGSDTTFINSLGSASSKNMGSTSQRRELGSRETSFSASGSRHSSEPVDSPRNNLNDDVYNPIGRRDSSSSQNSIPNGGYSVDDPTLSNHSSFNTRTTGSGNIPQNATSSLRNGGSSRNLLEAAEDTIEEIRAEAKMWERNARKLMVDLDIIKKEFSDQSKNQANLYVELSAANTEVDGLKKQVEQLKLSLEESKLNLKGEPTFQDQGASQYKKELENELKFHKDSNYSLALQLTRSQESNIELVSVLQELEATIEKQKGDIEKFSTLEDKFNDMENIIQEQMEKNKILTLELQQKKESETDLLENVLSLEKSLEAKGQELENERHLNHQKLVKSEAQFKQWLSDKEKELASLEEKLFDSSLVGQIEVLKEKVQELEKDCNELTDENLELLLKLKDSENNSSRYISSSESETSDYKSQIDDLDEQIKSKNNEDQPDSSETSEIFFALSKELEIAFALVRKPWFNSSSPYECKFDLDDRIRSVDADTTSKKEQAETILNSMVELNKLLDARSIECGKILKNGEVDNEEKSWKIAELKREQEDYILKANNLSVLVQTLERMKMELEVKFADQGKVMVEQNDEIMKLEAYLQSKNEELRVLQQCRSELELQVSDLKAEKILMEDNIESVQRESNVTSKSLDNLRNDLVLLNHSVNSHVSVNKILKRKSSELESKKYELELHLSELERENILLLKQLSGLEAQLKHTTNEVGIGRLELDSAKSLATSLQDEIIRCGVNWEIQSVVLKQKLKDTQSQWSEVQEEHEKLKRENLKLEANANSLSEESKSLQILSEGLRKENLELHVHRTKFEAELNESRDAFVNCSKRVLLLEEDISTLVQDYAEKKQTLNSELNVLVTEKNLLNQMYLEKKVEVEALLQEVEHLNQQIASIKDKGERFASDAAHEAMVLREDNARLESALLEVQSKVTATENELNVLQTESEMKVKNLKTELASSKQSHDTMKAANGKMSKLLLNYKSSEDKLKTIENGLELKLTVSEYERQQLMEETAGLKVQLLKVEQLQDEILELKNALNAMTVEKERLESSLHVISGDCEELKAEKVLFLEKISTMQKAVYEFEEYKQSRADLEEKLLKMEGDPTAKDALCAQEAELKNELSRIKSANRQLQWKIEELEEEKGECGMKNQALEEELNLLKKDKRDRSEVNGKQITKHLKSDTKVAPIHEDMRYSKGDNGYDFKDGCRPAEVDHQLKIQLLENELTEALEANMYKAQLNSSLPEWRNNHPDNPRNSKSEGVEVVAKERYERTKSSLQAELRDLRERYFDMSLKYAEVEAQREELVMKLKTSKSGKRRVILNQ